MPLDPFDKKLYEETNPWWDEPSNNANADDDNDTIKQPEDSIPSVIEQALEAAKRLQQKIHTGASNNGEMLFDVDVVAFLLARLKFMYQIPGPGYKPSPADKTMLNNMGIKENKHR